MFLIASITAWLWLVLLFFLCATSYYIADAVVQELTPELEKDLRRQKTRRYFVKMDAGPCDYSDPNDICRMLERTLWQPLSQAFPEEIWTRLNCARHEDLCFQLSTRDRVTSIRGHRQVDFLTVAYTAQSPTSRVVELYRASQASPAALAGYIHNMLRRDLPFEPATLYEANRQLEVVPERHVSLAVLVLTTTGGLTRPDVWRAFLASSPPGATRLFVHTKEASSSSSLLTSDPSSHNDIIHVPSVFSHRGTIALVRPVLQLLRYAIAHGGASHYVLVSGDSVPLWSAADMIRHLTQHNQTRFERHAQDEFKVQPELRNAYPGSFRKSKNWVLWNDAAAQFFARHDETHNFEIVSMADEYYWINVAQAHGVPWADLPVMYDEWPVHQAERPHVLRHVQAATFRWEHGHLFARKITNETILELDWMTKDDTSDSPARSEL